MQRAGGASRSLLSPQPEGGLEVDRHLAMTPVDVSSFFR